MVIQLETSFGYLSHGDFIIKIECIMERLAAHERLAPWPDFVPAPAEIKAQLEKFRVALGGAVGSDSRRHTELLAMRSEIEKNLTFCGQYAVMKATKAGDNSIIDATGLSVKTRTYTRSRKVVTLAPTHLILKHGKTSGDVIASATAEAGVGPFELQVSEGTPEREDAWRLLGVYKSCHRMEAEGLQEATKCYFRLRAHGANGAGPWSEVASLVII